MYNFTTETQGLHTFRVCEIEDETQLDTIGLGMLLNNRISGLCPVSSMQMDNRTYIRYNISSQIPLQQFFMGKVDKKRFLTVLNNILSAIENMEDYMLDPKMLLFDKEEMYVNVGTLQTDLIYYPIIRESKEFDVSYFVKNLIMSTEFDSNEQDNYVTLLINYLNHTEHITIKTLKEYITTLLKGIPVSAVQPAVQPMIQQSPVQPMMQQPQIQIPQPQRMSQEPYSGSAMSAPVPMPAQAPTQIPNNTGFAVPGVDAGKEPAKKKGLFSFLEKKPPKEKTKKEKPVKEKKSKKKEIEAPAGMVIPNMDNTKNSTLPQPPRPAGAPMIPTPSAQPMMQQPAVQPMMQQPPVQPMQQQLPVQPMMQQPPVQPMMQQPSVQPMMQRPQAQQPYATGNFGETMVLGAEAAGETTVLNAGYNTVQKTRNPYLIRKKTNDRVEINKNVFRIGKEKTYVDYCIMDNSAVSRSHADIIKKNDEFYIIDNNSLNHTFLNGKQIPSSQMHKLEDYMIIKLADEIFEFRL